MIQKKTLIQFYIAQYEEQFAKRQKRSISNRELEAKMGRLTSALRSARVSRLTTGTLNDYHKQIKNLGTTAAHRKNTRILDTIYHQLMPQLVQLDMDFLLPQQREGLNGEFLAYLRNERPGDICEKSLFTLYPEYKHSLIKGKIVDLVPTRPELEFPQALEMERRFILHIGPTNSGKTYQALERLKTASHGVYLGPLRLLALEVYEKMKDYDVPCTMLTGQECIEEPDSRVVASTVEMADMDDNYDIAVIDEAQMMADEDRGHSWTRAILGLQAKEIHVCASPVAEKVLKHLIELCGDSYEIHKYERKTKLVCEKKAFVFPDDVQQGDALIVFSKKAVLDVAGRLEDQHIPASVIYGSLPPEIRRRQMHLFTGGQTKVAVATDAIGMGLNLPVRRIVFLESEKFDGTKVRPLKTSEVRQIAGRAGRFGIYDTGYMNALGEEALEEIRATYLQTEAYMKTVNLGFPQVLLDIEEPLDEILKVWHSVEPSEPFQKENIDEALFLYERAYREKNKIDGFDNKRLLYKMITCPIDIKDRRVVALWTDYCKSWSADVSLPKPVLDKRDHGGIMKYETYYKQLDLYYQFSCRMGKVIDQDWLKKEREKTEAKIMSMLTKGKTNYITRCPYCGKLLPLGYPYKMCDECYFDIRG